MRDSNGKAILVSGSTGLLGSLVVATALRETDATLVLPVREAHSLETLVKRIEEELTDSGECLTEADVARLVVLKLPASDCIETLVPALRDLGVTEIVHCAGCLSYFDVGRLEAGNLTLTAALVELGKRLAVDRFIYMSTAFSSGFIAGPIPESLHSGPRDDPTDYTRTKRDAEWLVARSGLPFLILRPSIVVGDSRDGRYRGKPYGIYQLWRAFERYLRNGLPPVLHVVAGDQPVNFIHQDAFTAAFWAAYDADEGDGRVVHLASREAGLPTMRDLWRLWVADNFGVEEVHFYHRLEDVPREDLDRRLRLWLDFTSVNGEIASARWSFSLDTLERLRREGGLLMTDATLETLRVVQDRFVSDSETLCRLLKQAGGPARAPTRFISHGEAGS